jgi:hypothetical protein
MTVVKSFSKKISPSRKGGIRDTALPSLALDSLIKKISPSRKGGIRDTALPSLALDSLIDSEIVNQPSPRSITRFSSHNLKQDERTQEKVHKPGSKSSATPSQHSHVGKILFQEVYIGACA